MGNPEEISNIEHFPLSPRLSQQTGNTPVVPESEGESATARRSLTPSSKGKVEFWHQGESSGNVRPITTPKKASNHAHRADQLALSLGILAVLLLTLTFFGIYLTSKKYNFENSPKHKTTTPVVDFYQGNNAFLKKFHDEKEAKVGLLGTDSGIISAVNVDVEVSLKDQMDSMNDKLEKMRAQKLLEEAPLPLPSPSPKFPMTTMGVKAVESKKFDSPLEFNGMIPKSLLPTN
jgi:hypothetical protein